MKRMYRIAVILSLIGLLGLLSFFLNMSCAKKETEVYRIGAVLPLTGNLAFLGEPERNALLLAVEQIKQQGGIDGASFEINIEDSKGVPKDGLAAVNKLLNIDGVKIIIVTGTLICVPTQSIIEKENGVQFVISMHPQITQMSPSTFRIFPSGKEEATLLSNYLLTSKNEGEVKTVAVLYGSVPEMESEANEFLVPRLKTGGIRVTHVERYELGQKNFRALITKIKEGSPDALVIIGYGFNIPPILKEMKQQKLNALILGGIGFIELSGEEHKSLVEGAIFMAPRIMLEGEAMPRWIEFSKQYSNKYGKQPTYDAAYIYDQCMIIAEIFRKVRSSDPQKMRAEILKIKEFQGVTGKIVIYPDGDAKTEVTLSTYYKGQLQSVE